MSEDRSHGDDRIGERDEEFLWSGAGHPSDELAALEQQVRALAPAAPPPRLPGRRRALGMALLAGATAAGMAALLVPARALPARWIARVVPGLSSELAVTGGARVRWRAVPAPGAAAGGWREDLVARLERQGASRVDITPDGLVTADLPDAARAETDAWSRAAQGQGRLELRVVAEDHPLMRRIAALVGESARSRRVTGDPRAQALGVRVSVRDVHRQGGRAGERREVSLEADTREALVGYLRQIAEDDPGLAAPAGTRFGFEQVTGPEARARGPWLVHLLEGPARLDSGDIARARLLGESGVMVELTPSGAKRLDQLTAQTLGRRIAIVIDGDVVWAPVVKSRITGGRFEISFEGSPSEQRGQARAVAGALTGPAVPVSLEVTGVSLVGPQMGHGSRTLVEVLLVLVVGLVLGGATWLVERRTPAIDPEVSPVRGRPRRLRGLVGRAAVTALGGGLAIAAARLIPLPGIAHASLGGRNIHVSIFALGLLPVLSAFVLVELAALVVPPWRRLRTSGPAGRARLGSATAVLTVVLAMAQTWFIVEWLGSLGLLTVETTWMVIAALTAGTGVLALLALALSRFGLGNGFATLLLTDFLIQGVSGVMHNTWAAGQSLRLLGAACAVVLATTWILRCRVGGGWAAATGVRLPTAGVVPLALSPIALMLIGLIHHGATEALIAVGSRPLEAGGSRVLQELGAVALLSVGMSWLLSRPSRVGPMSSRGDGEAGRRLWRSFATATVISTGYCVAVAGAGFFLPAGLTAAACAVATAMVMDLVAEWRARWRRDDLVPVWPLHRIQRLDLVGDALCRSGIDVHARGAYLRSLLHFFGPFVPVVLMVPEAQIHEARAIIRTQLELPRPIEAASDDDSRDDRALEPAAPVI